MRLYDPIGGEHMNVMKAGLINSHRIVAVSGGLGLGLGVGGELESWLLDATLEMSECMCIPGFVSWHPPAFSLKLPQQH